MASLARAPAATAPDSEEEEETWSQSPIDVMESILKRLTVGDHIRAGAVCRSWRSAAFAVGFLPSPRPPWLLVSPGKPAPRNWCFYTFPGGRCVGLSLPEEFRGRWCCGISKGWLTFVDGEAEYSRYRVRLLNPISGSQLRLFECGDRLMKGIMSASPLTGDCIYAAIWYDDYHERRYVTTCMLTPRKVVWDLGERDPMDISFHGRRLYVLTESWKVMVYRFDGPRPTLPSVVHLPSGEHRPPPSRKGRLVESNGDVLIVAYDTKRGSELQVKVFKVPKDDGPAIEVNDLGGRTLFVGGFSEGFSVEDSELPQADCIYGLRGRVRDNMMMHSMEDGRTFQVAGMDLRGDLLGWFTPDLWGLLATQTNPSSGSSRFDSFKKCILGRLRRLFKF